MKIVRGELTPNALVPPSTRYDATCDCIQVTTDGGSTWVEAVGQDPRHQPAYLKPPVAGSNKQCDSAANMVKWLHDFMDQIIAGLAAGAQEIYAANTLIDFLKLCFPFAAYFIELIFEAAVDLFGRGSTALDAAFDSTTYDLLECIFFCHADANGRISAAQLTNVETDIVAQLNTTAAVVVNEILFIQGEIGLSNAGAIGSETGDCSACECGWCFEWDFTSTDGSGDGWHIPAGANGTYTSGTGYVGTFQDGDTITDIVLKLTKDFTDVTTFSYTYTMTDGCGGNYVQNFRLEYPIDTPISTENSRTLGTNLTKEIAGTFASVAQVRIDNGSGGCAATNVITKARISGTGTPPTLTDATAC